MDGRKDGSAVAAGEYKLLPRQLPPPPPMASKPWPNDNASEVGGGGFVGSRETVRVALLSTSCYVH